MRKWMFAALHALWLLFLQMLYLNSNWIVPAEEDIVEILTKVESYFSRNNKINEDMIFVNTAYSSSITSIDDGGMAGSIAITDRQKLSTFFNYLSAHGNRHQYMLCDISFTNKAAGDSSLATSVKKLSKCIFPSTLSGNGKALVPSVIPVHDALADYVTYGSVFSKMMLYQKNFGNSIPLQMFEESRQEAKRPYSFTYTKIGLWHGWHWMPNSIFPKFYLTEKNLSKYEVSLNSVLKMISDNDTLFYNAMFRNKIIVVGNFIDDVQPTAISLMPGSLILINSFLTLDDNYDSYSIWYLFFIFICFTLISYYVFNYEKLKHHFLRSKRRFVKHFLFKKSSLFIVLLLISLSTDLLFNVRSTVLLLMLYFYLAEHAQNIFFHIKKLFV